MASVNKPILKKALFFPVFTKDSEKLRFQSVLDALLLDQSGSLSALNYYLDLLNKVNTAHWKSKKKVLIKLQRDLYITYILLLNAKDSNTKYSKERSRCEHLLDLLKQKNGHQETIPSLELEHSYPGRPASYCGLQAGIWLGERVYEAFEAVSSKVNPVVEWMTDINSNRLYWVWGGGLLKTTLSLIPESFYYTKDAKSVANAPNRFACYLSWTLYFARFAFNSFLVLKETFAPPLTDKEKELGGLAYWERFKTQWDLKKFSLLNDSVWGIANLVCFFWFKGHDGDALTLALLVFDLCIAIWDFEEQKTKHYKKMKKYSDGISSLRSLLDNLGDKKSKDALAILASIKNLEQKQLTAERKWEQKKWELVGNLAYALSLMVAFTIMTLPFMPVPAAALMVAGVVGAVLCFAFTVIYNGIKGALEVRKEYLSAKDAKSDLEAKIKEFNALDKNRDDPQKILLYLEIKQLSAKNEYHRQMVNYQIMHLVRSILIQSVIPSLVLVSTVFLPLGIGLGVLGAGLAAALISNSIIENFFKAEKVEFSEFNNEEYETFCDDQEKRAGLSTGKAGALFSSSSAGASDHTHSTPRRA